jgi:hypothetical protein
MDLLLEGYLYWKTNGGPGAPDESERWSLVTVSFEGMLLFLKPFIYSLSMFIEYGYREFVHMTHSKHINHTLANYSVLGASPEFPQLAFPFHFLECV